MSKLNIPFFIKDVKSGIQSLLGILSRKQVFGGPRTIALIMSKECNSRCIMCWYHSPLVTMDEKETRDNGYDNKKLQFMDPALCETIIKEAHKMGTFRFILGGHGEPFLHPQFDNILNLTLRLGKAPYVITNGLYIDELYARILATKPAQFRISMHAGDVETWLRVHPTCSASQFNTLTKAIKLLTTSNIARVSLLHVIQRANFRHVLEMIEYAHSLGVKEIQFFPVRGEGNLSQVVLDPDEDLELRKDLQVCLKLSASYKINTNIRDYLSTNRYIRAGVPDTTYLYQKIPCYIGWIYTEFDIDGIMRPCENSDLVMGRAGNQHIKDMWYSNQYHTFRNDALKLPWRNEFIKGCKCQECCMSKFNINVHNLLRLKSIKYGSA